MKKIGFIGTGVMGKGMIRNLMKNGFELYVYNRTKEKALPLLEEGAFWCDTPALCAAGRDAVITMVGFPKDVEEVYFGENGVFAGADPGTYLVDMTTTEPKLSVKIYQEGKARGFHVVDAPVSGGEGGAVNATLSIMAGGDPEDFEACRPLWEAMGSSAVYEGKAGSGQHVKMANQIAIAGTVTGVSEAVAYAMRQGIPAEKLFETISGGAAGSWQLSNLGPKMAAGDYAPGFYIKHFIKDMGIALAEAEKAGLALPVLSQVLEMYRGLEKEGHGDEGTQGIIQYYQK